MIETPIALPMLRNRLSSDVPSVRSAVGSVAKAMTCKGMNTKPSPAPWMTVLRIISHSDTSGVHAVCPQSEQHEQPDAYRHQLARVHA